MKFADLKMGTRLALIFGMSLLLLGITGAAGYIGVGSLSEKTETALTSDGRFAEYSAAAYAYVLEQRRHEKNIFLRIDSLDDVKKQFTQWEARTAKLKDAITRLQELSIEAEDRNELASLSQAYEGYVAGFRGTYDKIITGKITTPQDGDKDILHYREAARNVSSISEQLAVKGNQRLQSLQGQIEGIASQIRNLVAIVFFCGLIFLAAVSVPITLSITRPIGRVVNMLADLNRGEIDSRLQMKRKDEIGQMAAALDGFADNLKNEIITAFNKLSEGNYTFEAQGLIRNPLARTNARLNDFMSQIRSCSHQIASGSTLVSDASQSLSQGATESASSLEEITSSITQMASQTQLNADNATLANRLAVQARGAAESGNAQMAGMISAMSEINSSSQNISKIIKTIDEIAFQTNLLALNAAVEAARAGQHGKGFAVVAEEVRNLAARSAKAARETADLIEGSVQKVEAGSQIADQTASALHEIVAGIGKVTDLVAEIASASNEQAVGISQINIGLSQIDQVTQQNTANAEEIAASAIELSSQGARLEQMLSGLSLKTGQGREKPARTKARPAVSAAATTPWPAAAADAMPQIALDDGEFGRY